MAHSLVLALLILQTSFIQSCVAVTCYGYNGLTYPDNVICPGSNACCGSTSTCEPNRLCHNTDDNNSTFIRGPCAIIPYDPNTCADICLYDEVNGFMPRVNPCADGSLCCNNDPTCCDDGRGVFLDSTGAAVSSPASPSLSPNTSPGTSTSTSSSGSSPTTTSSTHGASSVSTKDASLPPSSTENKSAVSQTSPAASSSTTSPSPLTSDASSGLSTGTKIGLGVGIPLGVLVLSILGIAIWFLRKRIKIAETAANQGMNSSSGLSWMTHDVHKPQFQRQYSFPMQEMDACKSPIELPAR